MRARAFLVVFLAVLLVPGVAQAKGPDQAMIDGDGMVAPISVAGTEGRADQLATLVELTGLFPGLFGQTPDPMLAAAPTEALGPKLVITWRLPDGGPTPSSVQQELYPYAEGGPLTFTPPDQPFMQGDRTTGGWFRTPTSLQDEWEAFGLPPRTTLEGAATAPRPTTDDAAGISPWPGALLLGAAVVGALAVLAARATSSRRVRVGST